MPLLDLSQVTYALIRLLERYLLQPRPWGLAPGETPPSVSISGDPPDLLMQGTDDDYALSLYLYHIQEDSHSKNLPEYSGDSPPVRFREMGLNLFYLLTAYGGTRREASHYGPYMREQRLMGLALKAFHDYPVLDASTRIGTGDESIIFPETLRGKDDEFRLTLHPATQEEINKVWTAATVPMRLSAIYLVSVVLMEAETPSARPVPVLLPQVGVGGIQPLWIERTESDSTFTLPGERRSRAVIHSPALAAVGETFRIRGFGFSPRINKVLLSSPTWADLGYTDVTGWMVRAHSSETCIELIVSSPVAGSGSERTIVPGLYQVHIQQGSAISNFSPLAVAPSIAPQASPTPGINPSAGRAGTRFTINGGPFGGTDISSVGVYFGTRMLNRDRDEFRVVSEGRVDVMVPADLDAGTYAVRVVVNGISTLPTRWFRVVTA